MLLIRFGGDLLSHALRRSTIGAAALNCRVRDGIGCFACAMTTKPKEQHHPNQAHVVYALDIAGLKPGLRRSGFSPALLASLLLDQIKPIGQLVSVN